MSDGVDLTLIGTQLARLQAEVRELKLLAEFERGEGRAQRDTLVGHVNAAIAGLHGRLDGLEGNINARFQHVDEIVAEQRLAVAELRQDMTMRLDRLEALLRAGP